MSERHTGSHDPTLAEDELTPLEVLEAASDVSMALGGGSVDAPFVLGALADCGYRVVPEDRVVPDGYRIQRDGLRRGPRRNRQLDRRLPSRPRGVRPHPRTPVPSWSADRKAVARG